MRGMSPSELFTLSGQLARKPFVITVTAVYLLGFASQVFLTAPVLARAGLLPFIVLHAVLLWLWFTIHAKRLRDAGRNTGSAVGIAVVNVLAITLLLLVIAFLISPVEDQPGETVGSILATWIVLIFLLKILSGAPDLGWLGVFLLIMFAIALVPILLAVGFSIWVGMLPAKQDDAP
jgi:uncharacterized membrane protein YhaH (DUF805 family)